MVKSNQNYATITVSESPSPVVISNTIQTAR